MWKIDHKLSGSGTVLLIEPQLLQTYLEIINKIGRRIIIRVKELIRMCIEIVKI